MKIDYSPQMGKFTVSASVQELDIAKAIPVRRYDKASQLWICAMTKGNVEFFKKFSKSCTLACLNAFRIVDEPIVYKVGCLPAGYRFKTEPMEHQHEALLRSVVQEEFGLLMDPGTGKTKIMIDDANIHFLNGDTNAVIVLCPNSIKTNWLDEINIHSPFAADSRVYIYDPDTAAREGRSFLERLDNSTLKWFILGIESLSHVKKKAFDLLMDFTCSHRAIVNMDESSRIGTHDSGRTQKAIDIGRQAKRRRIASGTALTRGIHRSWSQFEFLNEQILCGMNYYAFRNHFCIMGGFKGKKVIASKNEEEFLDLVQKYVYRKSKDVLNLPPKVYQKRWVQPTREMRAIYDDLKHNGMARVGEDVVTYQYALTKYLRLHQITGGFVGVTIDPEKYVGNPNFLLAMIENGKNVPVPGGNPKLDELEALLDDLDGKVIIWAKYQPEIQAIVKMLRARDDGEVVEFHGKVDAATQTDARRRFQSDPRVGYFVGQMDTGGIGITLTEARTVIYFSNSWIAENRTQSEDRSHRKGTNHSVTYIDILMQIPDWVDQQVLWAVQRSIDFNDYIHGKMAERQDNEQAKQS